MTVIKPPAPFTYARAVHFRRFVIVPVYRGEIHPVKRLSDKWIPVSHVRLGDSAPDGQLILVRFRCDGEVSPFSDTPGPGSRARGLEGHSVILDFDFELPTAGFCVFVDFIETPPVFAVSKNGRKQL